MAAVDSTPVAAELLQSDALYSLSKEENSRPPLQGWLLKQKSDKAKGRMFCSANRRYFTLDFETQSFYYAHTENSKQVSQPVKFREILDVEPTRSSVVNEDVGEEQAEAPPLPPSRSTSKGSLTSGLRMPRIPSFGGLAKRPQEQHGFVLVTAGRRTELLCASKEEADHWIAALRSAADVGSDSRGPGDEAVAAEASSEPAQSKGPLGEEFIKPELSTAPGSSRSSRTTSTFGIESETLPVHSNAGYVDSSSAQPPKACADEETHSEESPDVAAASGPPAQRRAFGLLPPRAPKAAASTANTASKPEASASTLLAAEAAAIKAKVLAAEAIREAEVAVAEADPDTVDSVPRGNNQELLKANGEAWGNCASGKDEAVAASRYADKGKGLSLQERLDQMVFSDDEDEDAAEEKRPSGPVAPSLETEPTPAKPVEEPTVDACESFQQLDGGSDSP